MTTYYTPPHWASTLVEGIGPKSPAGIIDPAVGDGSLLLCSGKHFPKSALFGVDVDSIAVARSRIAVPKAVISRANAIDLSSLSRSIVWRRRDEIDTVVVNPPFAGDRKSYCVKALGQSVVCGISGAHLMLCMEFYAPNTVAAIMPRSFFHSDRDRWALKAICQRYDVVRAGHLHRTVFAQGNASSEIMYFHCRDTSVTIATSTESDASNGPESLGIHVHLVRGGMPVHIAATSRSTCGLPYIHTKGLADSSGFQFLVSPGQRGIMAGIAILVPRVGWPKLKHLRVREISVPIQLSDCVLALCFESTDHASVVCTAMRRDFNSFLQCWAGTGAPYTTVSKVRDHVLRLGFDCFIASRWPHDEPVTAKGHCRTVQADDKGPLSQPSTTRSIPYILTRAAPAGQVPVP